MTESSKQKIQGYRAANSIYVVPFKSIREAIGLLSPALPTDLRLTRDQFFNLVKSLLRGMDVDEAWYRRTYPDVDQAIKNGTFKSAKHHFVEEGYFEGRRPGPVVVDEEWYLSSYPDVAEGIESGELESCQEHFDNHGEAEGRLPREY